MSKMADLETPEGGQAYVQDLSAGSDQAEASSRRSSVPARSDAGHSSISRVSRPAHLSDDMHRPDPWEPIVLSLGKDFDLYSQVNQVAREYSQHVFADFCRWRGHTGSVVSLHPCPFDAEDQD